MHVAHVPVYSDGSVAQFQNLDLLSRTRHGLLEVFNVQSQPPDTGTGTFKDVFYFHPSEGSAWTKISSIINNIYASVQHGD